MGAARELLGLRPVVDRKRACQTKKSYPSLSGVGVRSQRRFGFGRNDNSPILLESLILAQNER